MQFILVCWFYSSPRKLSLVLAFHVTKSFSDALGWLCYVTDPSLDISILYFVNMCPTAAVVVVLTLVMLTKLRCHAHFYFSANQIT